MIKFIMKRIIAWEKRIVIKWIRFALQRNNLTGFLDLIWQEHRKVFNEDNLPTRYAHFIECLGYVRENDRVRIEEELAAIRNQAA